MHRLLLISCFFAFFCFEFAHSQTQWTELALGTNSFTINPSLNTTVFYRYSSPTGETFPTGGNVVALFTITTTTTVRIAPTIYMVACVPPSSTLWNAYDRTNGYYPNAYASAICSALNTSTSPCKLTAYSCDQNNAHGNKYWLFIPGLLLRQMNVSSFSFSIFVNPTPISISPLASGIVSIDTVSAGTPGYYSLPINFATLRYFQIVIRSVNLVTGSSSQLYYLSFGQNGGDVGYAIYASSFKPTNGYSYGAVTTCSQASMQVFRNQFGSNATNAYLMIRQSTVANQIGSISIEPTIFTTSPTFTTLTSGVQQQFSVSPGKFVFLKFAPSVDRNQNDIYVNITRVTSYADGSMWFSSIFNGDTQDFPVYGCSGTYTRTYTATTNSSGLGNTFLIAANANERNFATIGINLQVLSGPGSITFSVVAYTVPSANGASLTDLVLGGPVSPLASVPSIPSSVYESTPVFYRIAVNPAIWQVGTQLQLTFQNISSVASSTSGRVYVRFMRGAYTRNSAIDSYVQNYVLDSYRVTWDFCGRGNSYLNNYFYVQVTGYFNTTGWRVSAALIQPSTPTLAPNSANTSVSLLPFERKLFKVNLATIESNRYFLVITATLPPSPSGYITFYTYGSPTGNATSPNGDTCARTYVSGYSFSSGTTNSFSSIFTKSSSPEMYIDVWNSNTLVPMSAIFSTSIQPLREMDQLYVNENSYFNGDGYDYYFTVNASQSIYFMVNAQDSYSSTYENFYLYPSFLAADGTYVPANFYYFTPNQGSASNFNYGVTITLPDLSAVSNGTAVFYLYIEFYDDFPTFNFQLTQNPQTRPDLVSWSSIAPYAPICSNVLNTVYIGSSILFSFVVSRMVNENYQTFVPSPQYNFGLNISYVGAQADAFANRSLTTLTSLIYTNASNACLAKLRLFTCKWYFPQVNSTYYTETTRVCMEDCTDLMTTCGYSCEVNNVCAYFNNLQSCGISNVVVPTTNSATDGQALNSSNNGSNFLDDNWWVIIVAVVGLCLIICIVILLIVVLRRRGGSNNNSSNKQEKKKSSNNQLASTEMTAQTTPYAAVPAETFSSSMKAAPAQQQPPQGSFGSVSRNFQVNFAEVKIERELGRGSFGVVYLASYRLQQVAVKEQLAAQSQDQVEEFLKEANVMAAVKPHKNVVGFIGISTTNPVAILTEYMPNGTVEAYFKQYKLDVATTVRFALDTCRGMAHLASEGIVHRDLACRNILLDKSFMAKITDFGMARLVEQSSGSNDGQTKSSVGPIKWMAPENILNKQYSTKSDVWSFGICIIEMLISGEPYPDLEPMTVGIRVVSEGYRHPIPDYLETDLVNLIWSCWGTDPATRPDFLQLYSILQSIAPRYGVDPN